MNRRNLIKGVLGIVGAGVALPSIVLQGSTSQEVTLENALRDMTKIPELKDDNDYCIAFCFHRWMDVTDTEMDEVTDFVLRYDTYKNQREFERTGDIKGLEKATTFEDWFFERRSHFACLRLKVNAVNEACREQLTDEQGQILKKTSIDMYELMEQLDDEREQILKETVQLFG